MRKFKAKKRQSYLEAITEEYLTEAKYFTNKHKQTAPLRKAMRKDKWFDHTGLFKKIFEGTFEDAGGADRPFTVWRPSSEEKDTVVFGDTCCVGKKEPRMPGEWVATAPTGPDAYQF